MLEGQGKLTVDLPPQSARTHLADVYIWLKVQSME